MSDSDKVVPWILGIVIILVFAALGVAVFFLKWHTLWGIPIALGIFLLLLIVQGIFVTDDLFEAAGILVVIIFLLSILGVLIYFFRWHTCWIISTIAGIIIVLGFLYDCKEAERKRKSDPQKTLDTLRNSFDNIFSRRILFDSNIWMNYNYDDFFTESFASIKKMNSQIMMPGIQLDEIENLKNSSDDTKKYAARCALKRIELAQQEGILALSGVGVDSKKYAYADPEFIKYLLYEAAELPEFSGSVFVTDDRALRIRINAVVKEQLGKEILVLSGEDLFEMVNALASARKVVEQYK